MKVSILYFDGCPNHTSTVERVRSFVADLGLDVEVEELQVTGPDDAARLCFLGSPTVQVDGLDIEPAARTRTDFAMSCRLYNTPDGIPSASMLAEALAIGVAEPPQGSPMQRTPAEAGHLPPSGSTRSVPNRQTPRGDRTIANAATFGSIATAVLSSACCWIPLVFLAFGVSAASVSPFFGAWRPAFVVAAILLLALSFYLTFVRRSATSAECCSTTRARSRLWQSVAWFSSAVIVVAFVFFPKYFGALTGGTAPPSTILAGGIQVDLAVSGMDCEACATSLTETLSKVQGVLGVEVDFATGTARVRVSDRDVIPMVIDAIRRAGFSATIERTSPP